ncbi:MAG: NADH-quinone oxidoreductase subunit J [Saprospiraceae bacterium]|uniref:NADH-quinone oxidoreductase subunit J n=1 Tax=Candidatus Defluviibacterium haderslevense TaxID=2981993 RepID=A0A9D7XD83_9BACT|nr:NADH-quinone oxidoreductase subunit J [Candidatus Defluviibacterium haderslevense]MBL0238632.1 NADH-quinone oxidoreductase subunit J [Candidatus Defluviibacterium haderslevense]
MIDKIFYILSALTIICATLVVVSRHPIKSVLFLVATFFLISAHYILLNAQFLALVNIVVYAGAIMVLFLFVIMFLNLNKEIEIYKNYVPWFAALISGGCLFLVVISALEKTQLKEVDPNGNFNLGLVENLGEVLYRDYLLPMELSAVLFFIAMVGVVLLNRKEIQE